MNKIKVPVNYDYVGAYLTNKCHLACEYCITAHHEAGFLGQHHGCLTPQQWIEGLNRLELPPSVPVTLQGGEPFLYKGIWEILEQVEHKMDILTALPPFLTRERFLKLKTLDWNKRDAPYPTIRVSYHQGQNDYKELIERIAQLQDILSIGLFYLDHPSYTEEEIDEIKEYARKHSVELRKKDFLGEWNGKQWGNLLYEDAAVGTRKGINVRCINTVVPIAPDGNIYRCHSDLYFERKEQALGNITGEAFRFPEKHLFCQSYGLCNECDIKVKTNHHQIYGYTSVDIKFDEKTDKMFEEERVKHEPRN